MQSSTLLILLLAFVAAASFSDAKGTSLLSVPSIQDSIEAEFRLLQDANATDDELDEEDDHDDDHDHEVEHVELTEAEILALEATCTCIKGSLYCSDIKALETCHCEGGMAHCDEEDHDDHDDHDHGDHDDHDDHDDHQHDDHDHGDHGHSDHHADHDEEGKPWGVVIGMSMVINITTLTGIFLIGGHWCRNLLCKSREINPKIGQLWVNVIIPMFACGCLMATSFFLLLPEALHLITSEFGGEHDHRRLAGDDHGDEAAATWRWGTSVMGGFLFPVLLHALFPHAEVRVGRRGSTHIHTHGPTIAGNNLEAQTDEKVDTGVTAGNAEPDKANGDSSINLKKPDEEGYQTILGCIRLKNLPLFVSMNLGEALHNFTDGIFVGAAYISCGPTLGNSVVLATVFHEIPNQLCGYLVMVNQNGIDPLVALLLNFLFGLSVLVGGLVVLVLDLSNLAVGSIFAIGAGIFLHVAIAEMLSTAERNVQRPRHMAYVLLSFIFGAVLIGLVLIDHEHCGGH